jgi:cell division protein FtsI/penicillin-binding protein 2
MVANFTALGILTAIRADSRSSSAGEPFRSAIRALAGTLAVAGVALLAALANIQVLRADDFVVRPHLGRQADGVRRYQYNQRVLDVIGLIPRGTIYDRTGLPLATSNDVVASRARDAYQKLGLRVDDSCTLPVKERCYPLGGVAFHVLGDVRTRRNWSATNTSYAERDLQDRLRGFDDRAVMVASNDASGRSIPVVRRDYRDLVPLLRHRHQPNHRAVRALLSRNRDVTLTVDARLQVRLASILAHSAERSANRHAAAVVIDADTGDLLASASYPYPSAGSSSDADAEDPESLLDRARYGLYPPGSTFKLVTAAAALRQDLSLSRATFVCSRLPDGRVGTTIPRWGTVRDDVLDTHPHGAIGMHDGLALSCNAYFAQLAVKIGPQALSDAATMLGIPVARDESALRLRATLPHAGYGQGDVVATPLRMARVAAAIASGGKLHDVTLEHASRHPSTGELLAPAAAALLRQYLRDAVLSGTARSLRTHPWRIAGKTGTAEVAGAPSHAWFVGFAPFGNAKKRVAFAVVVENAGYGGLAAAPAAGEIVTAAEGSGLLK